MIRNTGTADGTEPTAWVEPTGATELRSRLSGAPGLVVGLDFDGTLAPIEADPDAATIQPAGRRAVSTLAGRGDAVVAVISGRALSDLRQRVGVDGVVYVGNHGFEVAGDRNAGWGEDETVHPDVGNLRPVVARACTAVEERVGDVPGCIVERKGPTATVHYRRTPPDREKEVRAAVETVAGEEDDLHLVSGKQAIEVRPDFDRDKGWAMRRVVEDAPDGFRAVYVGDDTTDEDVFRALSPDGIGVHVGDREDTAAEFTLPGQDAVAPFLEWLDEAVLDGDGTVDRDGHESAEPD